MSGSAALQALAAELERTPARADGNLNALDFMAALRAAIERAENAEYEERMGEDL